MTDKIVLAEEVEGVKDPRGKQTWGGFDGYRVKTERQDVYMLISNGQNCCENWGYATSEDNLEDFIGANLISVSVTNSKLETLEIPEIYEGDVMFCTLETDRGPLQFAVYNEHNGYYGHTALIVSQDLNMEQVL